tara:strand:+ start:344 stop:694 length:351 start_codon:yes stop_codon:yes gene_type:complete
MNTTTVKVKHLKQSARKVRFVLNDLRGMLVTNALDKLTISNKKASVFIRKAIESGISNLSNQGTEFNQDDIFIEKAFVDEGPTMKRFRPRAMGRASQILKRTCHLTLTLTNKNNKR